MDALIGRYRAWVELPGMLVLGHPVGLLFDLTAEEALGLWSFLDVYRRSLVPLEHEDTGADKPFRPAEGRQET